METIYSWREKLERGSKGILLLSGLLLYFLMFILFLSFCYFFGITKESFTFSLISGGIFSFLITFFTFYSVYNNPTSLVDSILNAKDVNLSHPKEKLAVEIVNNLCLATGLRNVRVKVIPWNIINAMTISKKDEAVIYFTRGALEKLDYYELEAVAAHEIGHIKNKDSYYMTLGIVVAGVTIMLSYFLLRVLPRIIFSGKKRKKGGGFLELIALILMVIGAILAILSPLILRRILSKFSKEREYLADSDAIYITKNPKALIKALIKVTFENTKRYVKIFNIPQNLSLLFFDYERIETHPPTWKRILKICEITKTPIDKEALNKLKEMEEKARMEKTSLSEEFLEIAEMLFG